MKYLLLLSFLLAGCAKNSEISANDVQHKNQPEGARKVAAATDELVATFDQTEVTANRDERVHLHVLLSKKLTVPLSVNVSLADGTAHFQRDYAGFESGNHQSQAAIVDPGTLVGHFPKIIVNKNATCGKKFLVQLSADKNQNIALGPPAEILINCP